MSNRACMMMSDWKTTGNAPWGPAPSRGPGAKRRLTEKSWQKSKVYGYPVIRSHGTCSAPKVFRPNRRPRHLIFCPEPCCEVQIRQLARIHGSERGKSLLSRTVVVLCHSLFRTTCTFPHTHFRLSYMKTFCELCTAAPATLVCCADDAVMCGTCDER